MIVDGNNLFYGDLYLEEIWSSFGNDLNVVMLIKNLYKYFTGKYSLKGNLASLPYSAYFMSLYTNELKDIHVAISHEMLPYASKLNELSKIKKVHIYFNKQEFHKIVSEYSDKFMYSLHDIKKYNSRIAICNNIISYLYTILFTNVEITRMSVANSVMWIFWSMFHIPYLYLWPILLKVTPQLNHDTWVISLLTYILIRGWVTLIRSLQEVDNERHILQTQNLEPLIGYDYIVHGSSMLFATILILLITLFIIYLMFYYTKVIIVNLIIGLVYYIVMLTPIVFQYSILTLIMMLGQIILQFSWFKQLF